MATQYPLKLEEFVWALSAFCQLNRIPFDAELAAKQFPPPYTSTQLEVALQNYGFTTAIKQQAISQLNTVALPSLAILNSAQAEKIPASTEPSPEPPSIHNPLALILSKDTERVLVLEFGKAQPEAFAIKDFEARFTGALVMVRMAEAPLTDRKSVV